MCRFVRIPIFLLSLLFGFNGNAIELNDLSLKLDPAKNKAPNLDVKSAQTIGECDGKNYTNQAELDGCTRRMGSRLLNTDGGQNTQIPLAPKPIVLPH